MWKSEQGFTVNELLVAVAIFSIVLAGAYNAFLSSSQRLVLQNELVEMQTDAHKDAVALFSTYAKSGDDPAMKEFAKKTLSVLKMHEKHAKELAVAHQG